VVVLVDIAVEQDGVGFLSRDLGLVGCAVLGPEVELGLHDDKLVGDSREVGGSMMTAPYMPLAMCRAIGIVLQW